MASPIPKEKLCYSACAQIEPEYRPFMASHAGKRWEQVLNSLIDLGEELKAMNKTMISKKDLAKATDQMKADLTRHMRPFVSKKHHVISKKKN